MCECNCARRQERVYSHNEDIGGRRQERVYSHNEDIGARLDLEQRNIPSMKLL